MTGRAHGCVIAAGAVSALGTGREEAVSSGGVGEPARAAITRDAVLEAAGLRRPFAARALGSPASGGDRATELLVAALDQVLLGLEVVRPGFRRERLGIAIGTSSGGMLSAERFFAARRAGAPTAALARGATYFAPFDDALASVDLGHVERRTQILAACAASTIAIGVGLRWLERDACDLVLAGGYDALSVFVAAGFEALRAVTASRPRPFGLGRDGMVLGEGAGILAMVRSDATRGAHLLAVVSGFGASTDAVHITAPDRTGAGLARAATAALADAGLAASSIDLVSAHATATPFNDAMESRAMATVLGDPRRAVTHPFKAQIGHTLGAAGALETLAAARALATQCAPATANAGPDSPLDPDCPALLLERAEARVLRGALKSSAAFGGSNAALVLVPPGAPVARPARPLRSVHVRGWARAGVADLEAMAAGTGIPRDRLARLDALCRLGLAAVLALAREVGADALTGAAIVAGHALATLDTNEGFEARLRARGPGAVEPRVFPATSPNALAGECAIAFGLTGPSFAVGAGLDGGVEALARAAELVASGDAERAVVVAADAAGPVARDLLRLTGWGHRPFANGAVAALLTANDAGTGRRIELDLAPCHGGDGPIGHLSLLSLLQR